MRKNSTLKDLKGKLKSYSALAGAVVASGTAANADIVLNDIADISINTDGSSFEIDLNCDGNADARITLHKSTFTSSTVCFSSYPTTLFQKSRYASMTMLGASAVTYGGYLGGFYAADQDIGSSLSFANGTNKLAVISSSQYLYNATYVTSYSCYTGSFVANVENTNGNWANNISEANNKYMGMRMDIGGQTYYGWAKISTFGTPKMSTITLHSYALSDTPGVPIDAGYVTDSTANEANNLMVADIGDNDNGADLGATFSLNDTTYSSEMRVFAVPAGGDTLDICDAWGLLMNGNYMTLPLASDSAGLGYFPYSVDFNGQNDINGNPIVNGTEYFVYVYTRGNFLFGGSTVDKSNQSVLVKSNNSVTLLGIAEPVTGVTATDISDNKDASDLEVTFTEPANVSKQDTYKVFVVKAADSLTFDLTAANAVAAGNYTSVPSSGSSSPQTVNYTIGDKDVDGDSIMACTDYVVFVQSVANGTTADRDTLVGGPGTHVNLIGQTTAVTNIMGWDNGDNLNGSDLAFSFDPSPNGDVDHYEVIAVPTADTTGFTLADAQSASDFVNVSAIGPFSGKFTGTNDYNGAPIVNNKDYTLVVLSVNNGNCVNTDNMAMADTGVTLSTIYPDEVLNLTITAVDTADDRKPSDMHVTFDAADEQYIGSYHIVVYNEDFALSNSDATLLSTANEMLSRGDLTPVAPNGSATYETRLGVWHRDEEGNYITNYRAYRVYILSEGLPTVTEQNVLSKESDQVILLDKTGIEDAFGGRVSVASAANTVRITIDPSIKLDGVVTIHNSLGQIMESKNINSRDMMLTINGEKGIYFVSVMLDGKKITKKVFVN